MPTTKPLARLSSSLRNLGQAEAASQVNKLIKLASKSNYTMIKDLAQQLSWRREKNHWRGLRWPGGEDDDLLPSPFENLLYGDVWEGPHYLWIIEHWDDERQTVLIKIWGAGATDWAPGDYDYNDTRRTSESLSVEIAKSQALTTELAILYDEFQNANIIWGGVGREVLDTLPGNRADRVNLMLQETEPEFRVAWDVFIEQKEKEKSQRDEAERVKREKKQRLQEQRDFETDMEIDRMKEERYYRDE